MKQIILGGAILIVLITLSYTKASTVVYTPPEAPLPHPDTTETAAASVAESADVSELKAILTSLTALVGHLIDQQAHQSLTYTTNTRSSRDAGDSDFTVKQADRIYDTVGDTADDLEERIAALTTSFNAFTATTTSSQWMTAGADISFVGGKVGVGTTTPISALSVAGDVALTGALRTSNPFVIFNSTGATTTYIAQDIDTVTDKIFIGLLAGSGATNANQSILIGMGAGLDATDAQASLFIGETAGFGATKAHNSQFIGLGAGIDAIDASISSFIGNYAGENAANASSSVFIGYQAGSNATNAARSIFIGRNTGIGDTVNNTGSIASSSIVIGNYAGTGGFSNSIALGQGVRNSAAMQLNVGNVLYATGMYTGTSQSATPMVNGKVGLGTSTPSAQLTTTGTVRFSAMGAGTLQTDALGNVTVSSDERLKHTEGAFTRGIADLIKIDPITYTWKPETGYDTATLYTGFSAQNVQSAIPEAVATDTKGYLTLSDRPILAAVVNAVKELYADMQEYFNRTEELERKNAALEDRVRALEQELEVEYEEPKESEDTTSPETDDTGSDDESEELPDAVEPPAPAESAEEPAPQPDETEDSMPLVEETPAS